MEQKVKGYTLLNTEYIKEIDSNVHLYEHDCTKAKILYMQSEDPHKTFIRMIISLCRKVGVII